MSDEIPDDVMAFLDDLAKALADAITSVVQPEPCMHVHCQNRRRPDLS